MKWRSPGRWPYFTFFALVNVVCWLALAAVVGVLATKDVNLGVETFVREQQTRIVSSLRREAPPTPGPTPVSVPTGVTMVVVAPTAAAATATPPGGSPTGNPPAPPVVLSNPSLAELAVLDTELQTWPSGRVLQASYTQEALNRELAALKAADPQFPFRDLRAQLSWDRIGLTGTLTFLGLDLTIEATGRVAIVECRPQVRVNSLTMGGLAAPGLVRNQVIGWLQEWINWYPPDHPLCLQDVALGDGLVTVIGVVR